MIQQPTTIAVAKSSQQLNDTHHNHPALIFQSTKVFGHGGWALECTPPDMQGFDKLLASDPTRLHAFLVSRLQHWGGICWICDTEDTI